MITVKLKGYQEALEIWGSKPVRTAAVTALRKVANRAVTMASAEVRNIFTIKKYALDPLIKRDPARGNNLVEVIILSGKGVPLAFFNFKQGIGNTVTTLNKKGLQTKTLKRSAKIQGVEAEVIKGKKTILKSAFLLNMQRGYRYGAGIMQRQGKERLPLREKRTISVASMVRHVDVGPAVLRKVQDEWDKVFPEELNYQLNVKGKKA